MRKDTGGPAFPAGVVRKSRPIHDPGAGFVVTDITEPRHEGMFLRDFFAAKAMEAILQCDFPSKIPDKDTGLTVGEYVAKKAYTMADAMLAEREKGNSK